MGVSGSAVFERPVHNHVWERGERRETTGNRTENSERSLGISNHGQNEVARVWGMSQMPQLTTLLADIYIYVEGEHRVYIKGRVFPYLNWDGSVPELVERRPLLLSLICVLTRLRVGYRYPTLNRPHQGYSGCHCAICANTHILASVCSAESQTHSVLSSIIIISRLCTSFHVKSLNKRSSMSQ